MKANEFVKKYGLDTFRLSVGFVSTRKYLVVYEDEIDFADEIKPSHGECVFDRSEVKRLVQSHELVESYGGLDQAKSKLDYFDWMPMGSNNLVLLSKAVADVESCL